MAHKQTQFSNLFVDMETMYDFDDTDSTSNKKFANQVYNKLHDEIILFHAGVKSIMEEIDPIKHIIITKLQNLIQKAVPGGEVEVYGSHATKLCLHWSDIDLVLKPPTKPFNMSDKGFEGSR